MKHLFITCTTLLLSGNLLAQTMETDRVVDWNSDIYQVGQLYPGYIIKLEGDTVQGFIKAGQRCAIGGIGNNNQNSVEFYLSKSDRKPAAKYKSDQLKGYQIADKLYESINYNGGLFKKPNFNLVVKDGAIRVYLWYSTAENYGFIKQQSGESWQDFDKRRYESKTIIAKDPKKPIEHGMLGLSFSKNMSAMVEDNPELAEKIKSKAKGYTLFNFFDVINEYNTWAKSR
ncbi:hypothetical protein [Sphingobacterium sp. MYb382]|uniref:hypothetical protein n=1 Tax=Sphingobacterium sp. MYb382 TaxID=2745278 RepID=UPI0030A9720D